MTRFSDIPFPDNIDAALIDMDGVLYDSMPHHARAWHQMMKEAGVETDPDEFFLYEGMTGKATINLIFNRELHRPASDEEATLLYARKAELFVNSGRKTPMKGADRMLRAFIDTGVPRVLVTGSAQNSLLGALNDDYPGAFPDNLRVTALDVKHGKPDPEPYLMGAAKAGIDPSRAIVVENAPLGVRAGKAAGAFTVAVTTGPIKREEFVKEGADIIFPSMDEFADWLEYALPLSRLRRNLDRAVKNLNPATVTIVTDSNVERAVMPMLKDCEIIREGCNICVIPPGEDHKNIETVQTIWQALEDIEATRRSVVVNIGGGLVTDTGGFAAATFKRGIRVVNLPTTLLGAVDAATGGKTGINFKGLKNEIGAFHLPSEVIISALPLATLSQRELLSGYAEMLKTALIADDALYRELLPVEKVISDHKLLERAMKRCVEIKEDVVAQDPTEKGLRKILNFGHTAGHAFESLSIERGRPLAHGEAVAHGLLVELILSHMQKGLPSKEISIYVNLLKENYPNARVGCEDIPILMGYMAHDKKNANYGRPNFTLLTEIGNPEIDCLPTDDEIKGALEIYLDYLQ